FLDGGLRFGRELAIVLDDVVRPVAYLPKFGLRKLFQFRSDPGNFAHRATVPHSISDFKYRKGGDFKLMSCPNACIACFNLGSVRLFRFVPILPPRCKRPLTQTAKQNAYSSRTAFRKFGGRF